MRDICPCGSEKNYLVCCGRFIKGKQTPTTPEELMRSRYSAYSRANIDYIVRTMKSPAADNFDANIAKEWAEMVNWHKLEVLQSEIHGQTGYVEFIAYYVSEGQIQTLHELSKFQLENGSWYYVDGERI